MDKKHYPGDWNLITARQRYMARYTCQKCNRHAGGTKKIQLAVHHINGKPYDNRDTNLIVLCRRCHLVEELKKAP